MQDVVQFTREEVEAVLETVRPYLRRDGGDIELVAVEGANVRVRMRGACKSCPSSTVTLTMGVEKQLREELAGFGELIAEAPGAEESSARPRRWWSKLTEH